MSTHHHVSAPVVGGAVLGLVLGHEVSARQRATGESYGKAASATLGYAAVGAIGGPLAFGAVAWGLLMHPLVTIPSLFVLAWLIWWLRQPSSALACTRCGAEVTDDGADRWVHVGSGYACADGLVRPFSQSPSQLAATDSGAARGRRP